MFTLQGLPEAPVDLTETDTLKQTQLAAWFRHRSNNKKIKTGVSTMSRLGKLFLFASNRQSERALAVFVSDCRKGFVPSGNQFGAVSRNADF